jgi:ACS family glucarate transporter-like MFS transporter
MLLIRWRILALLLATAFVGYVQRTGVAIAAERIMPELGLTQVQIGWLLTAFLVGYTAFQLPSALVGQWIGARRALTWLGIVTVLTTCATAVTPAISVGTALLVGLLSARCLLGVAQAALFPVASGAIEQWFPPRSWGVAQGLLMTGVWLGTAATPPMVAILMARYGWQLALVITGIPALLLIAVWQWYGRDRPAEHPAVSAAELDGLSTSQVAAPPSPLSLPRVLCLLRNRQVLLITTSYFLMNYVFYLVTFWCFLYLVQERHLSTLESGWLASLPFLVAAAAAAVGGWLSDSLTIRFGERRGRRLVPLLALPLAAAFLYATAAVASPYWAVANLSLAFACVEVTEGPYWAATMRVAPSDSMATTAILNTGGNLGGIVATPIIAALSSRHSWIGVFVTGTTVSLAAALLWFWVDAEAQSPLTLSSPAQAPA